MTSSSPSSTRQRLVSAAVELFAAQGLTETTTRQIAERAGVNEVTLFRQFGNKHGLLLAVLEESAWLGQLSAYLVEPPLEAGVAHQALKTYLAQEIHALEQIPAFMRSVLGEAGHYLPPTRQALGQALRQANQFASEYLETALAWQSSLSPERTATLLNCLVLGYVVIEWTTEFHGLWESREDFLDSLVTLVVQGSLTPRPQSTTVEDLSPILVQTILERAKKSGHQDYAVLYVLFATGITPEELLGLQTVHPYMEGKQYILRVGERQVPIQQHILGKRYGSYNSNPLTDWLKHRKDNHAPLFIDDLGKCWTREALILLWQRLTTGLITPVGTPPQLEQTRYTWGIEMLRKGLSPEDMSLLLGVRPDELAPYQRRVKEKEALEQALKRDH
jgi:AcrR family transcriptional regulator